MHCPQQLQDANQAQRSSAIYKAGVVLQGVFWLLASFWCAFHADLVLLLYTPIAQCACVLTFLCQGLTLCQ